MARRTQPRVPLDSTMTAQSVLHVICPEPAGARGGADLHVRDLSVCQRSRGLASEVLVLGDPSFACAVKNAGGCAASVPLRQGPGHVAGFLRAHASAADVAGRPGPIVHAHGYEADYVATIGHVLARTGTLIATAHGFLRIDLRMQLMTAANLQCLRRAAAIICAGRALAEELTLRYRSVVHIPNGIPEPLVDGTLRAEGWPRLGFVGRFSPEKAPLTAVEVHRRLNERGLQSELHLFGGGPLVPRVEAECARLGLKGAILHGFVDDVDKLFSEIDVLIVPSQTESSPRAILEAMARGVAVVAYSVGDVSEMLSGGDAGWVARPQCIDDLVEGCAHLLADPVERAALADRARRRWEDRYRIEAMAEQIEQVYKCALASE